MRQVSIRKFQRNFYKEIVDLPVTVVKRVKPKTEVKVFVVLPPDYQEPKDVQN